MAIEILTAFKNFQYCYMINLFRSCGYLEEGFFDPNTAGNTSNLSDDFIEFNESRNDNE